MSNRVGCQSFLQLTALALLLGACSGNSSPTPFDPGGNLSGAVVRDGIEYRAEVLVMESFPVQLAGRATVRNRSDRTRTVTFADGCVTLMRAYLPDGGTPVWDQGSEVGCTLALVPVELAPGEERVFPTPSASAYEILAGGLPDGPYRITVYLRPVGGEPVEIVAGTTDLAIPR